MKELLDKIQIEFFGLYNEIYDEKIMIEPLTGNETKWSSSAMFSLTPFHIERSKGNLTLEEVHESKPDKPRITEAIYERGKLVTLKNWKGEELIGLSVLNYNDRFIKQTTVSIDDGDQELKSLRFFEEHDERVISKSEATIYGAQLEKYIHVDGNISEIQINKRIDMINESIDFPNGITDCPITSFSYFLEYQQSEING